MNKFSHFCPWCGTTLGINEIEDESTASRCPSCNNIVIIKEHGAKLRHTAILVLNAASFMYMANVLRMLCAKNVVVSIKHRSMVNV